MKKAATIVSVIHPKRGHIYEGVVVDITSHFVKVYNGERKTNTYPDVSQNASEWYPIDWCSVEGELKNPLKLEPVLI